MCREFSPCPANGTCDWVELTTPVLQAGRWYATNHLLPDGTQIIIGGRSVFTFEYIPPNGQGQISLPLLTATNDAEEDNLYPFVFLLPDGNLFIFANTDSIIYSYLTDTVVSTFPPLPGNPRNYPSAGSAVMLPLLASNQFAVVEVLVCGGAQYGAFLSENTTEPCSTSCGRITVTDPAPAWAMETMPIPRCMGDMILLPSQDILIINGAQAGTLPNISHEEIRAYCICTSPLQILQKFIELNIKITGYWLGLTITLVVVVDSNPAWFLQNLLLIVSWSLLWDIHSTQLQKPGSWDW